MTESEWNSLSTFSQLSNIAGDVKSCVDSRLYFLLGIAKNDYSNFYFEKVTKLVRLMVQKEENIPRQKEFFDELEELKRFLNNETDGEYIMRYLDPFTKLNWKCGRSGRVKRKSFKKQIPLLCQMRSGKNVKSSIQSRVSYSVGLDS